MITKSDLDDWEMENGEDVICDGPYYFSDEDDKLLCNAIVAKANSIGLTTTLNITNLDSMELIEALIDECDTQSDIDDFRELVLDATADILNLRNVDVNIFR